MHGKPGWYKSSWTVHTSHTLFPVPFCSTRDCNYPVQSVSSAILFVWNDIHSFAAYPFPHFLHHILLFVLVDLPHFWLAGLHHSTLASGEGDARDSVSHSVLSSLSSVWVPHVRNTVWVARVGISAAVKFWLNTLLQLCLVCWIRKLSTLSVYGRSVVVILVCIPSYLNASWKWLAVLKVNSGLTVPLTLNL